MDSLVLHTDQLSNSMQQKPDTLHTQAPTQIQQQHNTPQSITSPRHKWFAGASWGTRDRDSPQASFIFREKRGRECGKSFSRRRCADIIYSVQRLPRDSIYCQQIHDQDGVGGLSGQILARSDTNYVASFAVFTRPVFSPRRRVSKVLLVLASVSR